MRQFEVVREKVPQLFKDMLYSVVQGIKVERLSLPRPAVGELDEQGDVVSITDTGSTSVSPVYSKRTVLKSSCMAGCWKETKSVETFTVRDWYSLPSIKPAKTLDEMMKLGMKEADEVELKTEDNVMDFVDSVASSEQLLHVENAFQKVERQCFQCSRCTTLNSVTWLQRIGCLMGSVLQER